ncbi:hypothetical protein LGK97_09380 [Clostridium sp. CS001]|nr:hypothetical protein [Clostridium sp. CS001]MCB2289977.1 hypothetical protein [Clostridium sp. CS001]
MKLNLILKNFIILIAITVSLKGSFYVDSTKGEGDYKDTYGVQLVLAN